VAAKHGLFVVSDTKADHLRLYSLVNGALIRIIGCQGDGKAGLCVSTDGDSVLVAERCNNRVQEIRIVDGSWVRFLGDGVLKEPEFVDCNADVIVVSENCHRISVMSWADGSVWARLGSYGSGLGYPRGVRLLADGSGVVVADCWSHWVCVFTLSGEVIAVVGNRKQGLNFPHDVLECAFDGSFIVANIYGNNLIQLSRDGAQVGAYGHSGSGDGELRNPTSLTALPSDGCLIVDFSNRRVQHLVLLKSRLAWMRACASCML
jgi:hypothetical protein